jgi:hypothetical protein
MDVTLAPNVIVRVHDSTSEMRYMVLPVRPAGTEVSAQSRYAGADTSYSDGISTKQTCYRLFLYSDGVSIQKLLSIVLALYSDETSPEGE